MYIALRATRGTHFIKGIKVPNGRSVTVTPNQASLKKSNIRELLGK